MCLIIKLGGNIMFEFFNYKFYIPEELKVYLDPVSQRFAILTKDDDDIHITVELINDELVFHPRWSINIVMLNEKEFKFTTNI
jgi:hypothetical protein